MAHRDTTPSTFATPAYTSYADAARGPSRSVAANTVQSIDPSLMQIPAFSFDQTFETPFEHQSYPQSTLIPDSGESTDHVAGLWKQNRPVEGVKTYAEALRSPSAPGTKRVSIPRSSIPKAPGTISIARSATPSLSYGPSSSSRSAYTKSTSGTLYSYGSSRLTKARRTGNAKSNRPPVPVYSWLDEIENSYRGRQLDNSSSEWVHPLLPNTITSNPNFHSGVSENAAVLSAQARAPRGRRPPRSDLSGLALSSRAPSEASSTRSPLSATSLNARRTKEQMRYGHSEHRCSTCQAGFNTKSEVNHHMRSHEPYEHRAHVCDVCPKRFAYPKDLRRHMVTHAPKQLFCPHSGCKFANTGFRRQDHLERHVRSQHGFAALESLLNHSGWLDTNDKRLIEPAPSLRPEGQLVAKSPTESDPSRDPTLAVSSQISMRDGSSHAASMENDPDGSECHCSPEECHADTCSPEELAAGRVPDIRKLIAFLARHGGSQTSTAQVSSDEDKIVDTVKRIEHTARSYFKRARHERSEDDGDPTTPEKPQSENDRDPQTKSKFRCPFAAACELLSIAIVCDCCKWDGSARFCDVRTHIKRSHVDEATGLFKHFGSGHTRPHGTFAGLDQKLRSLTGADAKKCFPKWCTTFRYIFGLQDAAHVPSAFVDPCATQRLLQSFLRIADERDFWTYESIMNAPANPAALYGYQNELQHFPEVPRPLDSSVTTTFVGDDATSGLDAGRPDERPETPAFDPLNAFHAAASSTTEYEPWQGSSPFSSSQDAASRALFSPGGSSCHPNPVPGSSNTTLSIAPQQSDEVVDTQPPGQAIRPDIMQAPAGLTPPSAVYQDNPFGFSNIEPGDILMGLGAGPAQSSSDATRNQHQYDVDAEVGQSKGKKKRKWQRLDL